MKRRNAESGKMRRPLKRTKITEGMYGNSMLYLKFVMLWVTVVLADYMLEFRFEFLWPFWMMLRSIYDSFKYHGIAFSVFFICIALTSNLICFFFIPLQYIFFAASTYVWVQYVWYTFADKGVCLPTVAICCLVVYVEGALRARTGPLELWRPLAAHCLGYPALSLGFGVKAYVGQRLRLRRQRQVRAENEFYFQLLRDALPEPAPDQNGTSSKEECKPTENGEYSPATSEARHMNGSVRRRCARDHNGVCVAEHPIHVKLEKLEKHLAQQTAAREKSQANASSQASANANASTNTHTHAHTNGTAGGPGAPVDDDRHEHSKGSGKSAKCEKKEASTVREERKKHKNRDKDKDKESSDSHKSTEQTKEILVKEKEVESTKETVKSNKDSNNSQKDRDKEKEKREDKERETREREQKERELRSVRELSEELKRVRAELGAALRGEAEARRALAAAAATERARRADHLQLRQAHAQLQHKVSTWRSGERVALERRLSEERRARTNAEHQLLRARHANRTPNGECENEWCRSRRSAQDADSAAMRRELQKARDRAAQLQKDLAQATDQVRSLEVRAEEAVAAGGAACGPRLAGACAALQERAAHLERSLSAETRVKLDLLSALGDAKRHLHIQEGLISRQEKEIEELKAQMLAVMPTELVAPGGGVVSKLRRSDASPLDPNATVYTPKQLCGDA
ncbi:macoilin isoform X1 [Maniola jurtina]|uniref:macoilin isoform X1 n=1 Tax=Maniola jurtina TaxID=191418 RepID=UPI001E68CC07|nr:macoilin isoform X1 [Maniola jurtina]XP_045774663.1 macoilin isoform X1 [Maniola jurtina]